jgi:hypothetical protein
MAIVGVPIADAKCNGAESFVTMTRERPMSSADSSRDSFPVQSIARAPAARVI